MTRGAASRAAKGGRARACAVRGRAAQACYRTGCREGTAPPAAAAPANLMPHFLPDPTLDDLTRATTSALNPVPRFPLSKKRSTDVVSGRLCLGFEVLDAPAAALAASEAEARRDPDALADVLGRAALHVQLHGLSGLRANGLQLVRGWVVCVGTQPQSHVRRACRPGRQQLACSNVQWRH